MLIDTISKLDEYINFITESHGAIFRPNLFQKTPEIEEINTMFYLANQQELSGNKVEAIKQYKSLLSIAPEFVAPRFNLAKIYRESRNPTEAVRQFEIAAQYNVRDPLIYIEMGAAYSDLGKKEEELDAYFHALEISPENVWAIKNIGQTLSEVNRNEEALDWLNKGLRIIEEKRYQNVTEEWNSVLIGIYLTMGNIYQHMENYQASEKYFLQGIKIGEENLSDNDRIIHDETMLWWNLSEISIYMKKWQQAVMYANKCLKRFPNEEIFQNLALRAKNRD